MKLIFISLLFPLTVQAQFLDFFNSKDKMTFESNKIAEKLKEKLGQSGSIADAQLFAYLDEIELLNIKYLSLKKDECSKLKNNSDCKEELVDFEETYLDKTYNIKKDLIIRNHKNTLSELELAKSSSLKLLKESLK